jgi:hypothetical protein
MESRLLVAAISIGRVMLRIIQGSGFGGENLRRELEANVPCFDVRGQEGSGEREL